MVQIDGFYMRDYRIISPVDVNWNTSDATTKGQATLDFIQRLRPETPVQRLPIHHVPSAHICLRAENLPAEYERLKKELVEFVSPLVRFSGKCE